AETTWSLCTDGRGVVPGLPAGRPAGNNPERKSPQRYSHGTMTHKHQPHRTRRSGRQLPAGFRKTALLAAALLLLAAPAAALAETGTLTGKIDRRGFLGVLVCLDLDHDQQCGPDEPFAIPGEDGSFTLKTDGEPGTDDVLLLELSRRYEGTRYEAQHVILAAPAEPGAQFSVFGTAELAGGTGPAAAGFSPEARAALE